MSKTLLKIFTFFLAINLWNMDFLKPIVSDFGNNVSIAQAHHKPWHTGGGGSDNCKKNPKKCQPPTVSELPIQYMILSGATVIALCGGMAFYIRKRKLKSSPEA